MWQELEDYFKEKGLLEETTIVQGVNLLLLKPRLVDSS